MKNYLKRKKKLFLYSVILISGLLIIFIVRNISDPVYLAKNHPIDANLLVIEGWLPDSIIDKAYIESQNKSYELLITTGIKTSELDYCMVAMNGYLIFYPGTMFAGDSAKRSHAIEVLAHSKMSGKYNSHFSIFVNDSLIKDFSADKKKRKYRINWEGSLNEIDSLMIKFDNDLFDEYGDRNLYVKEIIVDNAVTIPYQFNSVVDFGTLDGKNKIINNFITQPEVTRNKLIEKGVDPLKIIAVTGKRTWFNRTLESALAFRKWTKTSCYNVTGINIVSQGIHARRTWMTYKKVMDKSYKIGIISLQDSENSRSKRSKNLAIITETLDLIYYWIILLPY